GRSAMLIMIDLERRHRRMSQQILMMSVTYISSIGPRGFNSPSIALRRALNPLRTRSAKALAGERLQFSRLVLVSLDSSNIHAASASDHRIRICGQCGRMHDAMRRAIQMMRMHVTCGSIISVWISRLAATRGQNRLIQTVRTSRADDMLQLGKYSLV